MATSVAARNVSATPTTLTWFGVSGLRPSADTSAWAWRRTQASNRVVNTRHLQRPGRLRGKRLPCFLVDLDDLCRDCVPRVASGLLQRVLAQAPAQLGVARQDDQRRRQLPPVLRRHGDAVLAGLQDRKSVV